MKEVINYLPDFLPALPAIALLFGPKKPSKKDLEEANKYGGSDWEDWREYEKNDNIPSCDKGGHKERSIANDPKHIKHWKKKR